MELVVRPWTEDDAAALTRAVTESVEHLRPWMAWVAGEPHDEAWRRAWIRDELEIERTGGDRLFGYWLDGRVVGAGGLHRRIAPTGLEIGYWVPRGFPPPGGATARAPRPGAVAVP